MSKYATLITQYGISELTKAKANKTPLKLTSFAIGDGEITPNEEMTSLKSQKYKAQINAMKQDAQNPAYLIIEAVVPMEIGGFYVNEVGIFDEFDKLFAIANVPPTYKPLPSDGSAKDLILKIIIEAGNANSVELKIDPGGVLATQKWSDEKMNDLRASIQANSYFVGQYIIGAMAKAPDGFLLCDGSGVNKKTYKDLFDVIGTKFGESLDKQMFYLPDFRFRFAQGASNNSLNYYKEAGLPNITGSFPIWKYVWADGAFSVGSSYYSNSKHGGGDRANTIIFDASRSSPIYGNSTTVQPPAVMVNYYIKY